MLPHIGPPCGLLCVPTHAAPVQPGVLLQPGPDRAPPPGYTGQGLTLRCRSLLCKAELFQSFLSVVSAGDRSSLPDSLRGKELRSYWDYKQASHAYQQAWQQLRTQAFSLWPRSDRDLLGFR
ncbi:hypothetical protein NHX12_003046 [Muraenolepis orangiensis]|uniref:tRNA-specific adenosine deaminase 1 n=1 Tax=Muraenolepis orangiensis TaxID=630683 RepID=A0A9Q0E206_9TELE|nr:hypothetical protein NHX12_003046 [Muraenolepis orangiensis]